MEDLEADKIPKVPHPRTNKFFYGHYIPKNIFLESFKKDKIHHAWLIHGPKGVGKATFAWKIAKLLQNGFKNFDELESNAKLSPTTRKIEALSEQSILLCRRQYDQSKKKFHQDISVSEIRKINHFFSLSSTESKYRIVILDNINELSLSGSNALLKILEEPPLNGIFILICENKRSILQTIVSRCRILEFNSLSFSDFKKALFTIKNQKQNDKEIKNLFIMSRGSVGKALEIQNHNGLEIFDMLIELLIFSKEINKEKIWKLLSLQNSFESSKDYHKFLINLLLSAITHISISMIDEKKSFLNNYNDNKIHKLYEKNYSDFYFPYTLIYSMVLEDFNRALKVNLNLEHILFTIFLKIEKIKNSFKL